MRRVQQYEPCALRHRCAQFVGIEREPAGRIDWTQRNRTPHGAGQRDRCGVRVVIGLEDDDLVADLAQREDRCRDGLGRADRHQDLGVRVIRESVPRFAMRRNRLSQWGKSGAGRVLVEPAADRFHRLLEHRVGSVGVGEPLAEIHRARLLRESRHLGEDRRTESAHPLDERLGQRVTHGGERSSAGSSGAASPE